jgi:hypothetical protein
VGKLLSWLFKKCDLPTFEKIRSPSNNGGMWDGDKKKLVVIGHNPIVKWQLKNFSFHSTHTQTIKKRSKFFNHPKQKMGAVFFHNDNTRSHLFQQSKYFN